MAQQGYIKLYRQLQDNWLWKDKRVFSKAEAWIDLLFMMNHTESKVILGNNIVVVEKGSRITSIRQLCDRWKWSNTKVVSFLDLLQNDEMIVYKSDTKKTVITVANWDLYQCPNDTETSKKHIKNDAETTRKHTNKNDKNEKNDVKNEEDQSNRTPYKDILTLYHELCPSYSKVVTISDERKKHIKARWNQYEQDMTIFEKVFNMAESSEFMKGNNDRHWKADLDWMMNETNMTKILEGKYVNKEPIKQDKPKTPIIDDGNELYIPPSLRD